MKLNKFGVGYRCYLTRSQTISSGTTPLSIGIATLDNVDNLSVQLITTGTLAGDWTFTASNDFCLMPMAEGGINSQNPGNFSPYAATNFQTTLAAVSSGGSSQILEKPAFCPKALKVIFTRTAGTGTATVAIFGKGSR
jgi:hypothetical protein